MSAKCNLVFNLTKSVLKKFLNSMLLVEIIVRYFRFTNVIQSVDKNNQTKRAKW